MDILWLGQPACHDRTLVGGKAAHLSLLAADYRVPPGFCLTAALDAWEQATSHQAEQIDPRRGLPVETYDKLQRAYREMATRFGVAEPRVAVRSSAIDEDGANSSFAGLHETFLNVVGVEAVARAVVGCWRSARSERALAYRRQQGLPAEGVRVAVLVQEMVTADCSAVVFSANPVTGSPEEIVINANWGLGESIVGGTVTPDMYTLRKRDLAVLDSKIGGKERMTIPGPEGTREVDTPRALRMGAALNQSQVVGIAGLARDLEQWMGRPVDVECAYQGDALYLLQCRAITGLTLM